MPGPGVREAAGAASQDLLPCSVQRPAAMPVVDLLPPAVTLRQITPGTTAPVRKKIPLTTIRWSFHRAMNVLRRQQRLQPRPLPIGQVMTLQALIVHTDDLRQDPSIKITGRALGGELASLTSGPFTGWAG